MFLAEGQIPWDALTFITGEVTNTLFIYLFFIFVCLFVHLFVFKTLFTRVQTNFWADKNLHWFAFRLHGTRDTMQVFERQTELQSVTEFTRFRQCQTGCGGKKHVLSKVCLHSCKRVLFIYWRTILIFEPGSLQNSTLLIFKITDFWYLLFTCQFLAFVPRSRMEDGSPMLGISVA